MIHVEVETERIWDVEPSYHPVAELMTKAGFEKIGEYPCWKGQLDQVWKIVPLAKKP
jgi:hypothetical protein